MRVLIVEDNERKLELVREVIGEVGEAEAVLIDIVHAGSVVEAAEQLEHSAFDLMLLDLNVPRRAGEPPTAGAGKSLLERCTRKRTIRRLIVPTHIMGLSAYSDEISKYSEMFKEESWPIVQFSFETEGWRDAVERKVRHILDVEAADQRTHRVDLAIVTALTHVELEAVQELAADWTEDPARDDEQIYLKGVFRRTAGRDISVVACAAPEMGMTAAASLTMKVIERYRPKIIAMAGIAAGIKGKYGDVLISTHAWDYGSGKTRQEGVTSLFMPSPSQVRVQPRLAARLRMFARDQSVFRRIQEAWKGTPVPAVELAGHLGGIATGASVVESKSLIDRIKAQDRQAVGVEMEVYGMLFAAQHASKPAPMAFAAKSVCDFGDTKKTDEYQRYAAFTSARFIYEFAMSGFGGEYGNQELRVDSGGNGGVQ